MNKRQLRDLKRAVELLETSSFGAKAANVLGTPIEVAIAKLPKKVQELIGDATQKSILTALEVALKTMHHHDPLTAAKPPESSDKLHTVATIITGALGGAFGLTGFFVELPLTTTIMMRSIADVARSEGADIQSTEIQLQCVNVLALGGRTINDDASAVGYFLARAAMTHAIVEATTHITKNGLANEAAPAIVQLILEIAKRFSIVVTEKAAAQVLPIIGAIGGGVINLAFTNHFQDIARGHFTVLRLESELGADFVKEKYEEILRARA